MLMNKFIKTDKKMLNALHHDAELADSSAHLVTMYSKRINDASVAPALTKKNIAFSLNRYINACNNIFKTLQQHQVV